MTFDDILAQVLDLLQRQGRVSYSALKRRFEIDDAYLDDLKDELLFAHPVVDELPTTHIYSFMGLEDQDAHGIGGLNA